MVIMSMVQRVMWGLLVLVVGCGPVDVSVHETPIKVVSDSPGFGRAAEKDDVVTIKFRVLLPNGREVLSDNSYPFQLGAGTVISGLDEAVAGMQVHGKRTVECPPQKHWGRPGYGDGAIPPNTTLTIHVEMLRIE